MKTLATLSAVFGFTIASLPANILGLLPVKMPLYLHSSDTDATITIMDVPAATSAGNNESKFTSIALPFIPPADNNFKNLTDINLTSLYGIKISHAEVQPESINLVTITIDTTAAKVPEGYPFTLAQVTDSVLTCVKLMIPTRPENEQKVTITILPVPADAPAPPLPGLPPAPEGTPTPLPLPPKPE